MKDSDTLRAIMTTDLKLVQLHTPFNEIKDIFDKDSFHHLPVVDEMKTVKGIISKHDFTKLMYNMSLETTGRTYSNKSYDSLTAQDFMTKNPVFLEPNDPIGLAADLFLENIYHAVPIVEEDTIVGIVTAHDLLVYAYNDAPVGGI